ncbi:MAG: helix-turn-helix domain-containing protein [Candidatus Thiodiazotropha sp.]
MTASCESDRLERLAEQNEHRSWADYGTARPVHPLLSRYIASYTYSVGCLREREAKLITRAYPTVMTQIYFEFYGSLSEIRGEDHGFVQPTPPRHGQPPQKANEKQGVVIKKRTYIKHGLGGWFDIYQLASDRQYRPIKNLKIDLYPMALYELFQCAPRELVGEDLQLADLLGHTQTSLMLEEMEAASSGQALIGIVERYLVQHLLLQVGLRRLEIHASHSSNMSKLHTIKPAAFSPPLPDIEETLTQQARRYHKSERWLQKRYAEVYGMSFKQIQGNLRFQKTHRELWQILSRRQAINLTELAYRSGYFDQAHFIKDFKRYTGMTPGKYLKANLDEQGQYLWYW